MAKHSYLVDPSHLKPFDRSDKNLLQVVIETPKGSRNKCPQVCRFRTTSDSFLPRRPMTAIRSMCLY